MNALRVPYEACGGATGFSPWGLQLVLPLGRVRGFFGQGCSVSTGRPSQTIKISPGKPLHLAEDLHESLFQ